MVLVKDEFQELAKNFYWHQKKILVGLGLWPLKENATFFRRVLYHFQFLQFFIFWTFLYSLCLFLEFCFALGNLTRVMDALFMLSTMIAVLAKVLGIKIQQKTFQCIVETGTSDTFRPENDEEMEIFKKAAFMAKVAIVALSSLYTFTLHLIMVPPVFFRKLPLAAYYPLDREVFSNFMILWLYQYVGLLWTLHLEIAYDTWCPSWLIYVSCQLDILANRLRHCGDVAKTPKER